MQFNHGISKEDSIFKRQLKGNQFTFQTGLRWISPQQYRLRCKIENAEQLLSMGHQCSEVADLLGYPDLYTFSHQFKLLTGMTPKEYRKGHIL